MGRDVPFDLEAICDGCGGKGAYDFMGDCFCQHCLDQDAADFERFESLRPQPRNDVTRSCGCVFCDLDIEPTWDNERGRFQHVVDKYNVQPCTNPARNID